MITLFFDTETTGLPDWKSPSGADHQPHMTQFAGALFRDDDHVLASVNLMVRPDGWTIPAELQELAGITDADAEKYGQSELVVFGIAAQMMQRADLIVAYNTPFDMRIMRIAAKRYADDAIADVLKESKTECAMRQAAKIIGGKWPKLGEAYQHFFNQPLVGAHNAMADVMACRRIWMHMRDMAEPG